MWQTHELHISVNNVSLAVSALSMKASMDKTHCNIRLSASEFFKDCPWLNIAPERRGEILVEPLYPHGGLLGGASSQGDGKPSKLAALAAARRKKENEKQPASSSNSSVAILDRLGRKATSSTLNEEGAAGKAISAPTQDHLILKMPFRRREPPSEGHSEEIEGITEPSKPAEPEISSPTQATRTQKMPLRRREPLVEEQPESIKVDTESSNPAQLEAEENVEPPVIPAALPSAFAQTLFGLSPISRQTTDQGPSLDCNLISSQPVLFPLISRAMTGAESAAFAEPSPDDIVLKAQNSKGPTRGARKA